MLIEGACFEGPVTLVSDHPAMIQNCMFESKGEAPCLSIIPKEYLGCKEESSPATRPLTLYEKRKQEKEQAMRGYNDNLSVNPTVVTNIEAVDHQERDARCHLNDRLYNIVERKDYDLQKQFNLRNDPYPHDPEDMVQRIKDGKYVIDESQVWGKQIIWRDPKAEPDKKGYNEVWKKVMTARQKVEDDIAVKHPEDALESLREFEEMTFS